MLHVPKSLVGVRISGVETMPGSNGFFRGVGSLVSRGRWAPPRISVLDPASIKYPEVAEDDVEQRGQAWPDASKDQMGWLLFKHGVLNPGNRARDLADERANPPRTFRGREKLLERIEGMGTRTVIATSFGALRAYHRRCSFIPNMKKIT